MATATDTATAATTAIARPRRCRYGTTTTSSETHSAVVPVVCPDGKLNPSAVVSQGTRSGRGRARTCLRAVSPPRATTRTITR
jgi:hypothetical protein